MRKAKRYLGWVLAWGLGFSGPAQACAFHGYTPNPTLVDVLMATEQVAVAALDPSNHGQLVTQGVLAGADLEGLAFPISAAARARLEASPGTRVLVVRDGPYGPWMAMAFMDDRFEALVAQVLKRQAGWELGGDADRVSFFAKRLNDPNVDIRTLALQELDRAPYGALRTLRLPKQEQLREEIIAGPEGLRPIRVLLAGLSGERSYVRFLTTELEQALREDLAYTGAYATALIELEGQAAVTEIAARLRQDPSLSALDQERLMQALAIHYGSGAPGLRREIAREIAGLAQGSAALREIALRQFGSLPKARLR